MNIKEYSTEKGPYTKGKWIKNHPIISWKEYIKHHKIIGKFVKWKELYETGETFAILPIYVETERTLYRVHINMEFIAYMQSRELNIAISFLIRAMTVMTKYMNLLVKLHSPKLKDAERALELLRQVLIILESLKKIGN